jgi:hypothetical protein
MKPIYTLRASLPCYHIPATRIVCNLWDGVNHSRNTLLSDWVLPDLSYSFDILIAGSRC